MKTLLFTVSYFYLFCMGVLVQAQNFTCSNGKIKFTSEAPLELIKAETAKTVCVISLSDKKFAFKVDINTFDGFNSPLQKEHFRENYMETEKYKYATFSGKIIEEIDLTKPGTYTVRAKGMMNIHGVEKEKIIKAKVTVTASGLEIEAQFEVPLVDHNIKVPKVVNQKISSVISVDLKATLNKK